MIVEYNSRYDEEIKGLFVELQEYIASIDKEGFNILTPNYGQEYFNITLKDMEEHNGKMLLYEDNGKVVGLVVGVIVEEAFELGFHAPKRGRVTELIVSKNHRAKGYGKELLNAMERYFIGQGCKNIIIEVFGYNDHAIEFYERNGYHTRVIDVTKNLL